MLATKEQIRQIIADSNLNSAADVYSVNIKVALDMILADGISSTHPLLLCELASWIDDTYEVSEFGRVVLIATNALGKKIRLELKQRNKDITKLCGFQRFCFKKS